MHLRVASSHFFHALCHESLSYDLATLASSCVNSISVTVACSYCSKSARRSAHSIDLIVPPPTSVRYDRSLIHGGFWGSSGPIPTRLRYAPHVFVKSLHSGPRSSF